MGLAPAAVVDNATAQAIARPTGLNLSMGVSSKLTDDGKPSHKKGQPRSVMGGLNIGGGSGFVARDIAGSGISAGAWGMAKAVSEAVAMCTSRQPTMFGQSASQQEPSS